MRDWIKALPLGLGLPLVIGAASVRPEDAASNIAAWLHVAGFERIPSWLASPNIDNRVIEGSFTIGAIYAFIIWGIPALRKLGDHPVSDDKIYPPTVTQTLPPVPAGLFTKKWVLNYNPANPNARKNISFSENGMIGEGKNHNEHRWSYENGRLIVINPKGQVQNRFTYDAPSGKFLATNDLDVVCPIKNQEIYQGRIR
jgi:hypothetical protein